MTITTRRVASTSFVHRHPVMSMVGCIAVCQSAGLVGLATTKTGNSSWYRGLRKPVIAPPPGIFGPVWTTLYTLMGLALFDVLRKPASPARHHGLQWFAIQLGLNALWTPIFFGLKSMAGGLAVNSLLVPSIAATTISFRRISKPAGLLMLPYLLWASFATILNFDFIRLNRAI